MSPTMSPESIADRLSQAIREKVFAPGEPLIQEDLAKRFNVSRNPVREALRILAAEGFVTMRPGEGAIVRALSQPELTELYELRLLLEPMIAPFIVQGAMRRNVAELREMAETMLLAESVESWMRLNFAFHAYLYSLADRPHTESILRGLLSSVQPYSLENIQRLGGREQASREHVEMVDAIQDGDAETLASLFVVHLQSAKERLVSTMSAEPDPLSDLRL